jgi:hypothetical protein
MSKTFKVADIVRDSDENEKPRAARGGFASELKD